MPNALHMELSLQRPRLPLKRAELRQQGEVPRVDGDHLNAVACGACGDEGVVGETRSSDLLVSVRLSDASENLACEGPVAEAWHDNAIGFGEIALELFEHSAINRLRARVEL